MLTLLRGGYIYSHEDPFATSLLIDGETIAWLGSDEAANLHTDAADVVVELNGALVTPTFVDAHVHTTATGMTLAGLDLAGAASLANALERIAAHCRQLRGRIVLGHGWDETQWPERRPPTREELDRASFGGVVYLSRVDVHSCVASSALLAAAPEAGAMTGFSADGWLTQDAHHAVRKVALESVNPEQRREAQRRCLKHAASLGIGSIHELGGPDISGSEDFVDLLTNIAPDSGLDVVGYWGEGGGPTIARALGARGAGGDHFVDGAIGSRTAFLTKPYTDADTSGAVYTTAATIRDHVAACSEAGVQAGYHVIGDAAMELVVAGFNEAAERVGADTVRSARHRLEHVEMVDDHAMRMLTNLGVVASVQPVFDAWWGGESVMYAERLGTDRASTLNPFASMLSAGVPLAFGSDAPVTPLGPWAAIRAAATHHQPKQRLPVRAAFSAHTRGGWRAAGDRPGAAIAMGAAASVAVWECGDLIVETPDTRVAAWSTDPRAGVPGLP